MDGRTDRRTDRPSYRDAWTHLKTHENVTVTQYYLFSKFPKNSKKQLDNKILLISQKTLISYYKNEFQTNNDASCMKQGEEEEEEKEVEEEKREDDWVFGIQPDLHFDKNGYGQTNRPSDGRIDRWTDGRMDGQTDGWMDGRMDGPTVGHLLCQGCVDKSKNNQES